MRPAGLAGLLLGALSVAGCQNAGGDRALGVQATGVIKGLVYLDRDGNQIFDAADSTLPRVNVGVLVTGTLDTVGRVLTDSTGQFRFASIPVGPATLFVDSTTLPAGGVRVTRINLSTLTVTPGDSFAASVAVGYPQATVAQARAVAVGAKLFVVGVALNPTLAFGDSTVHIADTSAAIVITRVRVFVSPGDSLRWLATRETRNGQPTLDNPTTFPLGTGALTPSQPVTSATAASARGGSLDAALVDVPGTTVKDTSTVSGNRTLTVDDGSGPLVVQLDATAGFQGGALAPDTVGAKLDVTGVLVANGATWFILPRTPSDVVAH